VAVLEYQGVRRIRGSYLGHRTNQQAEIAAACLGLEALKEPCRVTLISDSAYVIKTMQGLYKRKANLDYWRRLDAAAHPHRITWEWTRGHAGHPVQEKCDQAARLIAEQGEVDQEAINRILHAGLESSL
jgi:ribonuclease HI